MDLQTIYAELRIERIPGRWRPFIEIDLTHIRHVWYFATMMNELRFIQTTNEQFDARMNAMAMFDINAIRPIFNLVRLEFTPFSEMRMRQAIEMLEHLDLREHLNEIHIYLNDEGRVAFAALKTE